MHITTKAALRSLEESGKLFKELFKHGDLSLEIYKPVYSDLQKPHDRDEIYFIISGQGNFINDGKRTQFQPGDFIFVPAGVEHGFENFSADFSTWVIFFGPKGGEVNKV